MCSIKIGLSNNSSHHDNPELEVDQYDNGDDKQYEYPMKLQNSDVLANLDEKLCQLSDNVQCELKQLIHEREDIFPMFLVGPMLLIMTLMWVMSNQTAPL